MTPTHWDYLTMQLPHNMTATHHNSPPHCNFPIVRLTQTATPTNRNSWTLQPPDRGVWGSAREHSTSVAHPLLLQPFMLKVVSIDFILVWQESLKWICKRPQYRQKTGRTKDAYYNCNKDPRSSSSSSSLSSLSSFAFSVICRPISRCFITAMGSNERHMPENFHGL